MRLLWRQFLTGQGTIIGDQPLPWPGPGHLHVQIENNVVVRLDVGGGVE